MTRPLPAASWPATVARPVPTDPANTGPDTVALPADMLPDVSNEPKSTDRDLGL